MDEEPLRGFHEVHREDAAAHCLGGLQREFGEFRTRCEGLRGPTTRSVRPPVLRVAVHRGDDLVPDDEDSEVPLRLLHVLLDVEDGMHRGPEGGLVLDDLLRLLAVVHLRHQASPGAHGRLQDRGVADLVQRLQRGFRRQRDDDPRRRHARLREAQGGEDLVPAQVHDVVRVHRGDAVVLEESQRVQGAAVADAPVQHEVRGETVPHEGERDLLVVEPLHGDPAGCCSLEDPLLLGPDHGVEDAEREHVTHPSLLPLAGPHRSGTVLRT